MGRACGDMGRRASITRVESRCLDFHGREKAGAADELAVELGDTGGKAPGDWGRQRSGTPVTGSGPATGRSWRESGQLEINARQGAWEPLRAEVRLS